MPIDITQIGASGAVVVTVIIFLKFLTEERKTRDDSIEKLTSTLDKQIDASKKQREASHEVLTFMKKLNGKLENATIQKVTEQTVEHQIINKQDEL